MALAAQGLQGLHGSVASAMHCSTDFFAAQGLHGLHAARATPVLATAASDMVTASARGLRPDRLEAFFFVLVVIIICPII